MEEVSERLKLKLNYRKVIELATIIAMSLLIILFQAFKRFEPVRKLPKARDVVIKVEEVPLTQQVNRPPPPPRPSVPIPTESEDVPEDLTIESTEIDWEEVPPPPPPPESEEETPIFIPFDSPPEPIGGWEALTKNLIYPEIAKKAGVEGRVIIWAKIDEKGNVIKTKVMKSLGNVGCDDAAIAAIKKTKWKPAMQRDKPVTVWVAIPVEFRLKNVE
ncbi:MAG TPA: energy transducer TonB [Deltaproteobacteria bacterium]|nr:MAG: energy transducer TonB [candidate division KSB1 bacterium]RKY81292.1 MAG: energy transducer TonB [candidate division KSB1 bacterium]RKY84970.1 MAG: energy transducer TonB [candidate division KSB1 bacterium]RKY89198.1 MAG: energy transducer TonB [candidate division KSB1 bacterium]HEC31371.1 energy transducer TonB [Deltaproteobacteria bacterium]